MAAEDFLGNWLKTNPIYHNLQKPSMGKYGPHANFSKFSNTKNFKKNNTYY